MMIRRALIALALVGTLAGCATYNPFTSVQNPITQSRVDTLNATWGAALALANGYKKTCVQRLIPQTCRGIVQKMQAAVPIVQAKVVSARNFSAKPTLSVVDLIGVAERAVDDFKTLQSNLGVK